MRAAIDKITRQSRGRVSTRVEQVQISGLRPHENNARTHSPKQIRQIARSIETFGFVNPILIGSDERIICGHGRVAGAQLLGLATVPALRIEHLSNEELRAYALADNRLAEGAGWDKETLAIELEGLADLNFDVEVTGFDIPEIEMIFDSVNPQVANAEDDKFPDLMPNNVVTKQDDLWTPLGPPENAPSGHVGAQDVLSEWTGQSFARAGAMQRVRPQLYG